MSSDPPSCVHVCGVKRKGNGRQQSHGFPAKEPLGSRRKGESGKASGKGGEDDPDDDAKKYAGSGVGGAEGGRRGGGRL